MDLNGSADSTVQPCSKRPTSRSQIGFQSKLVRASFSDWPSIRPPSGFTSNTRPVRRSYSVSKNQDTLSLRPMLLLSRRISSTVNRSGSLSQQRATKYTFVSSKNIQTSVFSVAAAPACGSTCRKPDIAGTVA